ncbi:S1 family peptidase [Pendulispora albinea]|uniref:Trypsin-like serine protease n=1 Tax=Pendulispora albinea TaxID=2741071 RepID=A0ABZ2M498_9BACT
MKKSLLSVLLVASMTAACSFSSPSDSSAGEDTDSASQPIISGKASDSSQDSVVLLVHTQDQSHFSVCTGTLVASNLVLTARHCLSVTSDGAFGCDDKGNLSPGSKGGNVGADYRPGDISVYTGAVRPDVEKGGPQVVPANAMGKKIFHDTGKVICSHDLGLLQLDRELPQAKITPIRLDSSVKKGEKFTAIGWGVTLDAGFPKQRQARTGIVVTEVGPYAGSKTEDPVPPNDFQVGEATCQGDSGGPAFSEVTGAVIGVVSRGGNGADDSSGPSAGCIKASNDYTQTSPFKSLILQTFQAVGREPRIEEPINPGSSGGESKSGCSVGAAGSSSTPAGAGAMVALGIALAAIRRRRHG